MLTFEAADVEVDPFELEEVVKLADDRVAVGILYFVTHIALLECLKT